MRIKAISALVAILASLSPAVAEAEDDSVKYAYALCKILDNTGMTSSPCEVSGWNSSVTTTIDMSAGEARTLCGQVAANMRQQGARFDPRWTLQIKSPYSGASSIAFCKL